MVLILILIAPELSLALEDVTTWKNSFFTTNMLECFKLIGYITLVIAIPIKVCIIYDFLFYFYPNFLFLKVTVMGNLVWMVELVMKYEKDMNVYVQLVIKGQTVKVIINSENVIWELTLI